MKKIVFKNKWWRNIAGFLILLCVLSIIYGVIYLGVELKSDNKIKLPSILEVISRGITQLVDLRVLKALWITIRTLGISLCFAIIFGLLLGFSLGSKKKWTYTQPTVDFLRSIPITFLIPIFAIVAGSGHSINLYLLTIYPTALMIMLGVRAGKQKQDMERLHFFEIIASQQMQKKRYRREKIKLTFFETIPDIFSGFRIALSYGLVVVTVLEYLNVGQSDNSLGIGALLNSPYAGQSYMNMFALVLLIGFIGFVLNWITEKIQNRLIHWSNENLKNE